MIRGCYSVKQIENVLCLKTLMLDKTMLYDYYSKSLSSIADLNSITSAIHADSALWKFGR